MRNNPRLYLPHSRPQKEELELAGKAHMWKQTTMAYMEENCTSKGVQIQSNTYPMESEGIDSLSKRKKEGLIVISETDKSNRTTISSRENYVAQGLKHTVQDVKSS